MQRNPYRLQTVIHFLPFQVWVYLSNGTRMYMNVAPGGKQMKVFHVPKTSAFPNAYLQSSVIVVSTPTTEYHGKLSTGPLFTTIPAVTHDLYG